MIKLTKIERIRLSVEDVKKLTELKRFGINKSKFMREAILYKLKSEYPKLYAEENRLANLIKSPF